MRISEVKICMIFALRRVDHLVGPSRTRARSELFDRTFPITAIARSEFLDRKCLCSYALSISLQNSSCVGFPSFDRNFFSASKNFQKLIHARPSLGNHAMSIAHRIAKKTTEIDRRSVRGKPRSGSRPQPTSDSTVTGLHRILRSS